MFFRRRSWRSALLRCWCSVLIFLPVTAPVFRRHSINPRHRRYLLLISKRMLLAGAESESKDGNRECKKAGHRAADASKGSFPANQKYYRAFQRSWPSRLICNLARFIGAAPTGLAGPVRSAIDDVIRTTS